MANNIDAKNPSLIGIITNPIQQFHRISKKPIIGFAITVTTLFYIVGMLIGNIDENSIVGVQILATSFAAVLEVIIRVFTLSALFMFFTDFSFKSDTTLKHLGSMNTYITFVSGVNMLVSGIVLYIIDDNPTVLFTDLEAIIHVIFTIWIVILTAIGLERVAGFPKNLAWLVSILFISAIYFQKLGILIIIFVFIALVKFGFLVANRK